MYKDFLGPPKIHIRRRWAPWLEKKAGTEMIPAQLENPS